MSEVAVPSKASTIIVVRPETTGGFEILMTRRPQDMQVLAGFLVFPGGGVEEQDWSMKMLSRCRGLSPAEAQGILGGDISPEMSLGHWVAAARELFEEAGIHFFVNERGETPQGAQAPLTQRLAEKRRALSAGRLNFSQLLESEQLFCDLGPLTYLFHRVTPAKHTVRFDTRFYLAALPANQTALACSEEVAESFWITPKAALEQSESAKFPMMPPTIIALRTLAEHESWQDLSATFRLG